MCKTQESIYAISRDRASRIQRKLQVTSDEYKLFTGWLCSKKNLPQPAQEINPSTSSHNQRCNTRIYFTIPPCGTSCNNSPLARRYTRPPGYIFGIWSAYKEQRRDPKREREQQHSGNNAVSSGAFSPSQTHKRIQTPLVDIRRAGAPSRLTHIQMYLFGWMLQITYHRAHMAERQSAESPVISVITDSPLVHSLTQI